MTDRHVTRCLSSHPHPLKLMGTLNVYCSASGLQHCLRRSLLSEGRSQSLLFPLTLCLSLSLVLWALTPVVLLLHPCVSSLPPPDTCLLLQGHPGLIGLIDLQSSLILGHKCNISSSFPSFWIAADKAVSLADQFCSVVLGVVPVNSV